MVWGGTPWRSWNPRGFPARLVAFRKGIASVANENTPGDEPGVFGNPSDFGRNQFRASASEASSFAAVLGAGAAAFVGASFAAGALAVAAGAGAAAGAGFFSW